MDWRKWLPPKDTPRSGTKKYLVGQVWALRAGEHAIVFRVVKQDSCVHKVLARGQLQCDEGASVISYPEISGTLAILVQDVYQEEPTDPDILYQFLYMSKRSPYE